MYSLMRYDRRHLIRAGNFCEARLTKDILDKFVNFSIMPDHVWGTGIIVIQEPGLQIL